MGIRWKYTSKEEAIDASNKQIKESYEKRKHDPEFKARRAEVVQRQALKFREWLNSFKLEKGCCDCGYKEHPAALDLDHLGAKSRIVSHTGTITSAYAEIQDGRCVVRCRNCHQIKTWHEKLGLDYDPKIVLSIWPKNKVDRYKAEYKFKRGCNKCLFNKHFAALEFHHIGQKGMAVSQIKTLERFELEMTFYPCIILCGNCHQVEHNGEIA